MFPGDSETVRDWETRFSTRRRITAILAAPLIAAGVSQDPLGVIAKDREQDGAVHTDDLGLPAYNSAITILDNGPANPYGSTFTVNGLKGFVTDVNLILKGLRHDRPSDIAMMLAHGGRAAVVMRNVSNGSPVREANILLNDESARLLPDNNAGAAPAPLEGGTAYRPRDLGTGLFGGTAPGPSSGSPTLATFDGLTPNGEWTLWIRDDVATIAGSLIGWQLEIVTDQPAGTVIVFDNYRTRRDRTLNVSIQNGVLARDKSEPTSSFHVRVATPPKGKLKLREDGSFTYTPRGNRRKDSFTYTIEDEFGSSIEGPGQVNITIN